MKKKLLYLTSIMLFSILSINAQTTTWDLGGNVAPWGATATATTTNVVTDNLGLFPGATTTFAIIEASVVTFAAPDAYVSVNRFKLNGGGSAVSNKPAQRYLYFAAAGSGTVKIWFRTGGSGTRTLFVTDGTNVINSLASTDSSANLILTASYTNINGNIYIYGDQSCNIYKIEVTGPLGTTALIPALSTNNFQKESDVVVYANDGKIFLSNIITSTKVNVYNVLGALVKTAQLDADSSLDVNGGVYIVNAKSAEGEKSVKVIVP